MRKPDDPDEAVTDHDVGPWPRGGPRPTGASAILCLFSRTSFTARSMARFRPQAQILGFSTDPRTVRQLTMSWGARPYLLERTAPSRSSSRRRSTSPGATARSDSATSSPSCTAPTTTRGAPPTRSG